MLANTKRIRKLNNKRISYKKTSKKTYELKEKSSSATRCKYKVIPSRPKFDQAFDTYLLPGVTNYPFSLQDSNETIRIYP